MTSFFYSERKCLAKFRGKTKQRCASVSASDSGVFNLKHEILEFSVSDAKANWQRKRWTAKETKRLKNVLKLAINPQSDEDWQAIARSVGQRTGQECKQQAEKIQWVPPVGLPMSKLSVCSDREQGCDADRCCSCKHSDKVKLRRESSIRRSINEADFFAVQNRHRYSSPLELDPEDSLLQVMCSPVIKSMSRNLRKPFLMRIAVDSPLNTSATSDY